MKRILITGGTAGIGRELAINLAKRGDHVIVVGRSEKRLAELADEFEQITSIAADVASDSGQEAIRKSLTDVDIDVFVSGAAICWVAPIEIQSPQEIRETLRTSVEGAILTTRTVLPSLRKSRGALVLLSSVAAHIGSPGNAVYTASKFALDGFAESLAYEVADFGIRVRPVQIGHVSTGLISRFPEIVEASPYRPLGYASQSRLRDIGVNADTATTPEVVASFVVSVIDEALSSSETFLRRPFSSEQSSLIRLRHQTSDADWFNRYKAAVDEYRL